MNRFRLTARSRGALVFVTLFACLGIVGVSSASAATVTLKYQTWRCPYGGTPLVAGAAINNGGSGSNWSGSSITLWSNYGQVIIGSSIFCSRPWWQGVGYYTTWSDQRWVSFNGQTIAM